MTDIERQTLMSQSLIMRALQWMMRDLGGAGGESEEAMRKSLIAGLEGAIVLTEHRIGAQDDA